MVHKKISREGHMSRFLLFFALSLVSSGAFAAIKVTTKIEFTDGFKTSAVVVLNEGEWATVTQGDIKLKLRATKSENIAAKLEVELYKTKGKEGPLLGKSEVVTRWGEPVTIAAKAKDGHSGYQITLIPTEEP